jgi:hypothetical protein
MVILIPSYYSLSDTARSAQQDQDDRIAAEKHLADEPVLVDLASLLSIRQARGLCPHLFRVLKNHVAVTVECLDTGEQFAVVAARDQNLCARSDGGLEDGKRSSGELVLFDLGDFVLAAQVSNLGRLEFVSGNRGEWRVYARQLGARLRDQLPVCC